MNLFLYNVEIADRCGLMLSRLRANASISRRTMSEYINVSESTIKNWECGQGSPTLTVILQWFHVVGENPFGYMLEFFWPETFGKLCIDSTDSELRNCLSVYLEQVAGCREIEQLCYLVFEEYGGSWLGVLDMFCAHAHTSLINRYKIAEIIQTSYELSRANHTARSTPFSECSGSLLQKAIFAARDATLSHKSGYAISHKYGYPTNYQSIVSSSLKRARLDANIELSYIAKAMGKTERTIKSWEENTEPTFLDACAWFYIVGKPMWDYLRVNMLPGGFCSNDSRIAEIRSKLLQYFSVANRSEIRKLCYLIFWKHGSNWHSLLELMIIHVSCPLHQRVISARSVLIGYEIDANDAILYDPIGILPDMENLKQCIDAGTSDAKAGKSSYIN